VIKLRRVKWVGHVARMGKVRNIYKILVGQPEGKRQLGRHKSRWKNIIKVDRKGIVCDGVDWIYLAQDRVV
jgi:hypothetical protein